jgi:hypothetical protein
MRAGEWNAACDGNRIIRLLVDETQLILRIGVGMAAFLARHARSLSARIPLPEDPMPRSGGYVGADRPFPVLSLSAESIEETFKQHACEVAAERIGIVEREIRSGYSGFIFLTGIAR